MELLILYVSVVSYLTDLLLRVLILISFRISLQVADGDNRECKFFAKICCNRY